MTVYLVGAGPGDPGLMTVRGAELLAQADVVVYDRLADDELLGLAPPLAECVDVGKRPGGPVDQSSINELLVERGRAGQTVVRLKGGDPFVLGRGGEEAEALAAAGVAYEVVPGISSAIAVPAYAGIPVTHRGIATSFTVVTGHSRNQADDETDWDALARAGGTIVVLMAVAHRREVAERLMAAGRPPGTPVAAIHWGTRPDQRTVRTTLAGLAGVDLEPPATIVVGPVAALDLDWFESRPLFGRTVVITRPRAQAPALARRLKHLGAAVLDVPAVVIRDPGDGGASLERAAREVAGYDWVVFTSANGVDRFVARLPDSRAFGGAKVAAIGPATAAALARWHVVADLQPATYVAEELTAALLAAGGAGRVLVPRAAVARDVLPDGLRAAGWEVEVVEAYRTVPAPIGPERIAAARDADAIAFTSSSTVTGFLAAAGPEAVPPVVACIGPVTAATARAAGVHVDVVAEEHTIDGLVGALVGALAPDARP